MRIPAQGLLRIECRIYYLLLYALDRQPFCLHTKASLYSSPQRPVRLPIQLFVLYAKLLAVQSIRHNRETHIALRPTLPMQRLRQLAVR